TRSSNGSGSSDANDSAHPTLPTSPPSSAPSSSSSPSGTRSLIPSAGPLTPSTKSSPRSTLPSPLPPLLSPLLPNRSDIYEGRYLVVVGALGLLGVDHGLTLPMSEHQSAIADWHCSPARRQRIPTALAVGHESTYSPSLTVPRGFARLLEARSAPAGP